MRVEGACERSKVKSETKVFYAFQIIVFVRFSSSVAYTLEQKWGNGVRGS